MHSQALDLFSYGKILISGEFLILKGAKGLSLPVKFGQHMKVVPAKNERLEWISLLNDGSEWLHLVLSKDLKEIISAKPENAGNEIRQILRIVKQLNPVLFRKGYKITTKFDFDKGWGLGTSASLIANLAKWAQVNPFKLLDKTFNGSGYDVVTSLSGKSLIFQRTGIGRVWRFVEFNPPFKNQMYFIYLNKKQPTVQLVKKFQKVQPPKVTVERISEITEEMLEAKDASRFSELMEEHEALTGKTLRKKPVKQRLFIDYTGAVKSLGAWGGDMILAVGDRKTPEYFKEKGYQVIFGFDELIHQ